MIPAEVSAAVILEVLTVQPQCHFAVSDLPPPALFLQRHFKKGSQVPTGCFL